MSCVFAKNQTANQKLKDINKQIKQLQQNIDNSTDKRQTLYHELKLIDKKISRSNKKVLQLNTQISLNKSQLSEINKEIKTLNAELETHYHYLSKQLVSSYILGKDHALKLILNQKSPAMMNRMLTYYHYINNYRNQLISNVILTKKAIETKNLNLTEKHKQLISLQKNLKIKQHQLKQDQQFQQRVITSLNAKIIKNKRSLAYYIKNKKQLEKIVQHLNHESYNQSIKPFAKMRHKLPWPTHGKVSNHFGDKNVKNQLVSNGLTIIAPEGQKVTAIYPGKVVFADWLRGYGLLLIIDHGSGYMTLYAHNQSLFKSAGDKVNQGEMVGTVGHSGGAKKNSLYFEVRRDGKPSNPLRWLA
jgi:murein hydrolase activator